MTIQFRILVLAMALSALFLQGCMDQANGAENTEEETTPAIPVEASEVSTGDMSAFYSGTATLEAEERAIVVSQIVGVVLETRVQEGDFVTAGQVLAQVERDRYRLEVERTQARLKRLEMDFQRKKELYEKKLVSAEDYEQVSADYRAQKAAHDLAILELQYTQIEAPISGYISERIVRAGNLVKVHDPMFSITSYDPLLAVLHVPERELSVLRKGQLVSMGLDAWPGQQFTGEVIRISPVVDPGTGTFRVTAQIHDRENMLKPGLFGRVQIVYDIHESVPVIPRTAVITEDDTSHVYVINEEGTAQRRSIVLGYEQGGLVEVLDGLVIGEDVVTAGKGSISEGAAVEVIGDTRRSGP